MTVYDKTVRCNKVLQNKGRHRSIEGNDPKEGMKGRGNGRRKGKERKECREIGKGAKRKWEGK